MSYKAMEKVANITGLEPGQKYVLWILAFRANDDDLTCFPSWARLEKDTGLSRRSIARFLKALESKGFIRCIRESGGVTTYKVVLDDKMQDTGSEGSQSETTVDEQKTHKARIHKISKEGNGDTQKSDVTEEPLTAEHITKTKEEKKLDPEYIDFAKAYQNAMEKRFGKTAPTITDSLIRSCAETLDKAVRIDRFSFQEIRAALAWAYNDDFWKDQIKSLAYLRRKSDKNGQTKLQNLVSAYQRSLEKKTKYQTKLGEWNPDNARETSDRVIKRMMEKQYGKPS